MVLFLERKDPDDGSYKVKNYEISNLTVPWAQGNPVYVRDIEIGYGRVLFKTSRKNIWFEGQEICLQSEEKCSQEEKDHYVYCAETYDITSLANWTAICLLYILNLLPQQLIQVCALICSGVFSVIYLFPELIQATMTSNITFGLAEKGRKL